MASACCHMRTLVAAGAGMLRFDRGGSCLGHGETGVECEEGTAADRFEGDEVDVNVVSVGYG